MTIGKNLILLTCSVFLLISCGPKKKEEMPQPPAQKQETQPQECENLTPEECEKLKIDEDNAMDVVPG